MGGRELAGQIPGESVAFDFLLQRPTGDDRWRRRRRLRRRRWRRRRRRLRRGVAHFALLAPPLARPVALGTADEDDGAAADGDAVFDSVAFFVCSEKKI